VNSKNAANMAETISLLFMVLFSLGFSVTECIACLSHTTQQMSRHIAAAKIDVICVVKNGDFAVAGISIGDYFSVMRWCGWM